MIPPDITARLQAATPYPTVGAQALVSSLASAITSTWSMLESSITIPGVPVGPPGPITGCIVTLGTATGTNMFGSLSSVFIPPFPTYTPGVKALVDGVGVGLYTTFEEIIFGLAGTVPAPGGVPSGMLSLLAVNPAAYAGDTLYTRCKDALPMPLIPPTIAVQATLNAWAAALSEAIAVWVAQSSLAGTAALMAVI
ncbi:MAG: hypothetical protein A2Y38_04550 [Spirochaetes bacterium GWB1_59_5]|nr:MAG: hypothetical protein A2Y38_04550 [Spirochaetes bacterium GWB1_59_5]